MVIDSKDLFSTLSTCQMAADRSIRGDLISTRFEFATKKVSYMALVRRKINLADPGIKPDRQLTLALHLLFESGCLSIYSNESATLYSNIYTG